MGGQGVFLLPVFFHPSGISTQFLCDWSARNTGAFFFFFKEKPSRDWGKQDWPAWKRSVSWTGTRSQVLELDYVSFLLDQIKLGLRAERWAPLGLTDYSVIERSLENTTVPLEHTREHLFQDPMLTLDFPFLVKDPYLHWQRFTRIRRLLKSVSSPTLLRFCSLNKHVA